MSTQTTGLMKWAGCLFQLWSCWTQTRRPQARGKSKGQDERLIDRRAQPWPIAFWLAAIWQLVTQYELPAALKRARAGQPRFSCYLLRLLQNPKSLLVSLSPSATSTCQNDFCFLLLHKPRLSFLSHLSLNRSPLTPWCCPGLCSALLQGKTDVQHVLAKLFSFFLFTFSFLSLYLFSTRVPCFLFPVVFKFKSDFLFLKLVSVSIFIIKTS